MSELRRPLILTRPLAASEAFARRLNQWLPASIEIVISPLLELVATRAPVELSGVKGVIFSSQNGVSFAPSGALPAYCVGEGTTKAALDTGWKAQMIGRQSDELVATLTTIRPTGPLLHISGVHTRGRIAQRLNDAGLRTRHVAVYDQELRPLSEQAQTALARGIEPIIPLFSPRTARQFGHQARIARPPHVVAISDSVLGEVREMPATSRMVTNSPDAADMEEFLKALIERLETHSSAG